MPHRKPLVKVDIPREDSLKRMTAYQVARDLIDECWPDAEALLVNPITEPAAAQLYTAVVSIAANLAEGYSRSSGRDRARIFEYALGSARESTVWYESGRHVLSHEVLTTRLERLGEIRRILLAVIPRERTRVIRPTRS